MAEMPGHPSLSPDLSLRIGVPTTTASTREPVFWLAKGTWMTGYHLPGASISSFAKMGEPFGSKLL